MGSMVTNSQSIQSKIYTVRGVRVMLDRDLADLYQVTTSALNQAVKRNKDRFPADFMFQLSKHEYDALIVQFSEGDVSRSQNVILKRGHNIKYLPMVFSEQGTSMLSAVLKSPIAVEISIKIIRVFVELRQNIAGSPQYEMLWSKIKQIESKIETIEMRQIVGETVSLNKVTQLSSEVRRFSDILDDFQDNNLIIKRPDEDTYQG